MPTEIERKFLMTKIPDEVLKHYSDHKHMSTVYLDVSHDEDGRIDHEIRVRRILDDVTFKDKLTYKGAGTISREEIEAKVPEKSFFDAFAEKYEPVLKDFYSYPLSRSFPEYKDLYIQISTVDDTFIYAEVEFKSEEDAKKFIFPWTKYLIKEVTDDPNWKMANYWYNTRINKCAKYSNNNVVINRELIPTFETVCQEIKRPSIFSTKKSSLIYGQIIFGISIAEFIAILILLITR